jgi:hypothetical protein
MTASSENHKTFVVLYGAMPHTDKTLVEYVAHIIYGSPRIEAVQVGNKFVALLEYGVGYSAAAKFTFERAGSFPHGAALTHDVDVALQQFGANIRHYGRKSMKYLGTQEVRHKDGQSYWAERRIGFEGIEWNYGAGGRTDRVKAFRLARDEGKLNIPRR